MMIGLISFLSQMKSFSLHYNCVQSTIIFSFLKPIPSTLTTYRRKIIAVDILLLQWSAQVFLSSCHCLIYHSTPNVVQFLSCFHTWFQE